jgi:preprotein translocase subunit SecA
MRLARTAFPEREDKATHLADEWALGALAWARRLLSGNPAREIAELGQLMQTRADELAALDDAALMARLRAAAPAALQPAQKAALHDALLLVAEAAHRSLGMRPYPTQLVGAATLVRGQLAEMQTGEGKTLTAAVAACLAASAGLPVHVVTVNDYLAERDAEKERALFAFAGLSVGVVIHGKSTEDKRAAYACDIAYCTGKEMVFDYLRDRVAAGGRASVAQLRGRQLFGAMTHPPVLRGLHFAIVDESWPYIAKRLLTDRSPRLKAVLRYMIYGQSNVLDVERIIDIFGAFEKFVKVRDFDKIYIIKSSKN